MLFVKYSKIHAAPDVQLDFAPVAGVVNEVMRKCANVSSVRETEKHCTNRSLSATKQQKNHQLPFTNTQYTLHTTFSWLLYVSLAVAFNSFGSFEARINLVDDTAPARFTPFSIFVGSAKQPLHRPSKQQKRVRPKLFALHLDLKITTKASNPKERNINFQKKNASRTRVSNGMPC